MLEASQWFQANKEKFLSKKHKSRPLRNSTLQLPDWQNSNDNNNLIIEVLMRKQWILSYVWKETDSNSNVHWKTEFFLSYIDNEMLNNREKSRTKTASRNKIPLILSKPLHLILSLKSFFRNMIEIIYSGTLNCILELRACMCPTVPLCPSWIH